MKLYYHRWVFPNGYFIVGITMCRNEFFVLVGPYKGTNLRFCVNSVHQGAIIAIPYANRPIGSSTPTCKDIRLPRTPTYLGKTGTSLISLQNNLLFIANSKMPIMVLNFRIFICNDGLYFQKVEFWM